jgi:hypothetical protein
MPRVITFDNGSKRRLAGQLVGHYSDSRMTVPRNRSVQVDATPRSGDPARCKIGNTYSGIALGVCRE